MSNEAKVGLTTLIAAAIFVALLYFGGTLSVKERGYTLDVVFPTVGGLGVGGRVRVAGITIGEVERLRLENGKAVATLRITSHVPLYRNYSFTIQSPTLIGEPFVSIKPVKDPEGRLKPGDVVQGKPPLTLESIGPKLMKMLDHADSIFVQADKLLGSKELRGSLLGMADNLQQASANLEKMTAALSHTTVAHQQDLVATITAIQHSAENIQQATASLRDLASSPKLAETLNTVSDALSAAALSAQHTTEALEAKLTDPELDKQLRSTVANLHEMTANLQSASKRIDALLADEQLVGDLHTMTASGASSAKHVESATATIVSSAEDIKAMTAKLRDLVTSPETETTFKTTLQSVQTAAQNAAAASEDVKALTRQAKSKLKTPLSISMKPRFESIYNWSDDVYQTRLDLDFTAPGKSFTFGGSDLGNGLKLDLQFGLPLAGGEMKIGAFSSEFGLAYQRALDDRLALEARGWDPNDPVYQALLKYTLSPSLRLLLEAQHADGDMTYGAGFQWQY